MSHLAAARWLAVSSSGDCLSVALQAHGRQFVAESTPRRGEAKQLTPLLDQVLASAQLTLADVDAWVCDIGPGTFTGLRHGLALTRGLAFALGKPLYGVSALEAVLQGVDGPALAILQARRDAWYVGSQQPDGTLVAQLVRAADGTDTAPSDWPLPDGEAPVQLLGVEPPRSLQAALGERLAGWQPRSASAAACLAVATSRYGTGPELAAGDPLLVVPHYLLASEPEQQHGEVPQAVLPARPMPQHERA